ncbi:MAG: acetate--CoA ligase family protein, partial [Betaproteobacteria bacterium]
MSDHYLTALFAPRSIAVIGASDVPGSVGAVLMENLRAGPYSGRLYAVNPRHTAVAGMQAFPSIDAVPDSIDLAIVATRAGTLPAILEHCAAKQVPAVAIISAGLTGATPDGARLLALVSAIARAHGIRLLGPNSMGLLRPSLGMNATFTRATIRSGNVGLISQSGGLVSALLDWAATDGIGFSSVVSLGNQLDVDFAETLDFLMYDARTESVVLYLEGFRDARRFMSALRAIARVKPVIALKAGRGEAAARAARTHTGAMTGADEVFDTALRRAGAVRVDSFVQLFAATKYLSSRYRAVEGRLAIVTNGGGPGVMAADRAATTGLAVASLSPHTIALLDRALPAAWSRGNPVDLLEDATTDRFRIAVDACLADQAVDGVVVILTPQAMTDPDGVAAAIVEISQRHSKPLIACWMGDTRVASARGLLQQAQLPVFRAPEPAVEAFANIASFYRNQRLLMQVPGPLSQPLLPDLVQARTVIESVLEDHRTALTELESKAVLTAFHIPVAAGELAADAERAIAIADALGYPVAMKAQSRDLTHKSEVGGVRLGVAGSDAVRIAFRDIMTEVLARRPDARLDGIIVESMIVKQEGRELMVGVIRDPVFGPVITCGAGGTAVEWIADRSAELPPLNSLLAHNLIGGTRVATTLGQWRGQAPVDVGALELVLLRVSEMVCELPWIIEMDINPVIADAA